LNVARAPVTTALMIAIVVVFVGELFSGIPLAGVREVHTSLLHRMGAITPTLFQDGELWRLVTATFVHIGLLHLLLNLWALFQLGSVFEAMFGSMRFLITYFTAGIIASAASAFFTQGTSAGASGAIFGILGALIISIRRSPLWRHQAWARGLIQQLIGWAALNIIIGFTPGIDNAAHIGGFIAGLILGFIPHRVPPPPPQGMIVDAEAGSAETTGEL
jgi:rhomboid protease GluP